MYGAGTWMLICKWKLSSVNATCARCQKIIIQSSAAITLSNLVRYHINDYRNWGRISITCWIHKRHPIPRPISVFCECVWENWLRYNGSTLLFALQSRSSQSFSKYSQYANRWDLYMISTNYLRAVYNTVLYWEVLYRESFVKISVPEHRKLSSNKKTSALFKTLLSNWIGTRHSVSLSGDDCDERLHNSQVACAALKRPQKAGSSQRFVNFLNLRIMI